MFDTPLLIDTLTMSSNISPDKKAITNIFNNLSLELSLDKTRHFDTTTLSLMLPIDSDSEEITVEHDIRGSADVDIGTNATLIVYAASQIFTYKFKGIDADQFDKDGEFLHSFRLSIPAQSYTLSLILIVERDIRQSEAEVLLQVDSLDVEMIQPD